MSYFLFSFLFMILLHVINGQVSQYGDCPRGTFRENVLSRECKQCSKGYYGNVQGLTHHTCTGPCPLGTYGDTFGAKTIEDCKLVSFLCLRFDD